MEALPGPAALLDTRGIVVAANAAWRQAPHPECPALCAEVGACVLDRLRDARGSGGDDADLLLRRLQSVLSGELTLCEGPGAPGGRVSVLCVGMERDGQRCALLVLFRRSASDHTPTDALAGAVVPCGRGAGETTAERARLRSEQRYRDLVMSMTDVVWEVDVRGRLIYVSPQLRDLLGVEPEEAIGRSLYSLLSPPHAIRVRRIHNDLVARPRPFRLVRTSETHRLGHVVHIETSGAPVLGPSGQLKGFRCVTRDVSEIVWAEEALRESEERLRHLYHRTPAMLQTIDPDGLLVSVSDYWLERSGFERPEVIGRPAFSFLTPASREALAERMRESRDRAPGALTDIALQMLRKNGEPMDVLCSAVEERDARGSTVQWLSALVDVTERNLLERQLLHAQKMDVIGRLAGGMAHDFNNLLTVILGYADLAERAVEDDAPARRGLQRIRQAAERAARLTGQMLTVARRQPVEPETSNLHDLVMETSSLLARVLGEGIELETAPAADLWPTRVDPGQFEQVLINLVVNARDACATGGIIRIGTDNVVLDEEYAAHHSGATAGPHVVLTISDTGCGMTDEVLAHAFEPFFSTKESGRGTGLGLATCYGIVARAGGHIRITSRPGCGTTVYVYLPRASAPPQDEA